MAMAGVVFLHSDVLASIVREIFTEPVFFAILAHGFNNGARFAYESHNTMLLIFGFIKHAVIVKKIIWFFSFYLDMIGIKLPNVDAGPCDYF